MEIEKSAARRPRRHCLEEKGDMTAAALGWPAAKHFVA